MTNAFTTLAPRIMHDLLRDFPQWGELDVAACVGNLGHETGGFRFMQELKPVVPGSRGGYGWAQWTGSRRREFEAFCQHKGYEPASYEANYGFLTLELRTSESRAVRETAAASGLEAKVVAFELAFERAGAKHYPSRQRYAATAYDLLKGSVRPVEVPPSLPAPTPSLPTQTALGAFLAAAVAAAALFHDRIVAFFAGLFN